MISVRLKKTYKLLDLCCGVGGATRGYQKAGFHVTGVDIEDQPDYCGNKFIRADAIEYAIDHGHEYDFIHGSWPCQRYSVLTKGTNKRMLEMYPDLIDDGREVMTQTGRPWVIENVLGAPIRKDLMLCGEMFGLRVIRHRYFEFSECPMSQPSHPEHIGLTTGYRHGKRYAGPYFPVYGSGGDKGTIDQWRGAMGIDWTYNKKSIAESIPPWYTQKIGEHVLSMIKKKHYKNSY